MDILLCAAQKQKEAIPSDCGRKLTDQPGFLADPIQATFGKTRVGVRVNTSLKLLNTQPNVQYSQCLMWEFMKCPNNVPNLYQVPRLFVGFEAA